MFTNFKLSVFKQNLNEFFSGKYLVEEINKRQDVELAFVWNRTAEALDGKVPDSEVLKDLGDFKDRLLQLKMNMSSVFLRLTSGRKKYCKQILQCLYNLQMIQ